METRRGSKQTVNRKWGRTDYPDMSGEDLEYQNEAQQYIMSKASATLFESCFIQ